MNCPGAIKKPKQLLHTYVYCTVSLTILCDNTSLSHYLRINYFYRKMGIVWICGCHHRLVIFSEIGLKHIQLWRLQSNPIRFNFDYLFYLLYCMKMQLTTTNIVLSWNSCFFTASLFSPFNPDKSKLPSSLFHCTCIKMLTGSGPPLHYCLFRLCCYSIDNECDGWCWFKLKHTATVSLRSYTKHPGNTQKWTLTIRSTALLLLCLSGNEDQRQNAT